MPLNAADKLEVQNTLLRCLSEAIDAKTAFAEGPADVDAAMEDVSQVLVALQEFCRCGDLAKVKARVAALDSFTLVSFAKFDLLCAILEDEGRDK